MSVKYLGYRFAQWLSTHLAFGSASQIAERLADWQWRWSSRDRAAVRANLSWIREVEIPGTAPIVREVFRNFGRYLVEFFTIHQVDRPDVHVEGVEHLQGACRNGRGVIIIGAHVGNWEVGAVVIRRMGWPTSIVVLPHEDPRMDRLFNRQRERCGVQVIPLGPEAVWRSVQQLRQGHLLGVLGDRDFGGSRMVVRLGEREVRLPRGPAMLSLRSRAPLVPTFFIREGPWKFCLYLESPIWPTRDGTIEDSIQQLTVAYAAVLERYLKRFPEQWLMFQPFWHAPREPWLPAGDVARSTSHGALGLTPISGRS